ncbi:MAG TPA: TIGR02444 family protein [Pseudolabrys sp.]|nr:TIGR02444 family protein [Pseudolabrys sp.]
MGSPFWNFSIAVYGASAVQDECLILQDQFGLDVNLILLCAFLGAVHGVTLTSDDIASVRQEVGQWHEQIVRPLRAARRHLKTINLQDADAASAADLRRQVKTAELESERIEQILLERWADTRLAAWPRGKLREAVVANLQTLLAAYGVGPERLVAAHAMQHLIAAGLDRTANA